MAFSEKQQEYFYNATHRWNIKSGATRSGKTYMDYFVIPKRLRAVSGKEGLNVILGNTKGTLQRNIIEPLQDLWGIKYVSDICSDNTAMMFGERVYCLGADKINQVDRIRGSSIKYCYGDEVVTWHEDVFNMLKSRLDKEYSRFDGTCNPENPNHWFKKFLDSDVDIYLQEYTIDDNPFLPLSVKENLKREYSGTVFYDRYILGRWCVAEGLIYRTLADNPEQFMIDRKDVPRLHSVCCGEDFGGNKSGHAIVCSGIADNVLYVTSAKFKKAEGSTPTQLEKWSVDVFEENFRCTDYMLEIYADSAEQVLINGIREKTRFNVYNAYKTPIIGRIRLLCRLLAAGRVKFIRGECDELIKALSSATWDDKQMEDVRLDNGTYNNDIIDAFEYSFEHYFLNELR
ncbi:MAG: PBSX family phage terminase large subunit [Clostridia bacterium]|nr:PBSX family phage terminase large subunit [Clostridia bacterium]